MKTTRETISVRTNSLLSRLPSWQADYINRFIVHLRTPLYWNGYALLVNSVGTSVFGFVYWVFAARFYTTHSVGINSAMIAAMTFLAGIARLYLDGTLLRFLPRAGQRSARLITSSYLVSGLAAILVGAIFLLGLNSWAPALGFLRVSPILAAAFILATVAYTVFVEQDGVLIGLRQAKWVPVENMLFALAKLVLLLVLAKSFPDSGIFISWSIPMLLTLIPVNLLIFRKLLPEHNRQNLEPENDISVSKIAHYSGGLYIGRLFYLGAAQILPLLVLRMKGSDAAAHFALPWMILTSIQLAIPNMLNSMIVEASRGPGQLVLYSRQAFKQIARILIPAIVFLLVSAPYVLNFFGKSYAAESITLLRLLVLAALPQMLIGLYLGIARVRRSIGGAIAVQAAIFVISLSLSYFFLARFDITGVGMAWLISQTVVAVFLFFTQLRPVFRKTESGLEPAIKHRDG
jgi:O-antigen/teichoic acid export membrane protein